jgi:hypothetical protein
MKKDQNRFPRKAKIGLWVYSFKLSKRNIELFYLRRRLLGESKADPCLHPIFYSGIFCEAFGSNCCNEEFKGTKENVQFNSRFHISLV